jgi:phage repressor protein C with HTH and peptisase S24 domain
MEKISPIKENILYFLEKRGITKADFCKKTGISYANIKGKGLYSEIGGTQIGKILSIYTELSSEWLLTGKGEMLKTNRTNLQNTFPVPSAQRTDIKDKDTDNIDTIQENREKNFSVPLIPFDAVAGFNGEDNPGVRYEDCERYVVPEFEKSGVEFVIRVSGSSMYPKYSNGDILACRKINNILFFQWGKIYVIDSSSQGILVKRIYEDTENPDNIILVSDNKEKYPPHPMPKSDIRSLSIVLGVIRME